MAGYHFTSYALPAAVTAVGVVSYAVALLLKRFSRASISLSAAALAAAAWQAAVALMTLSATPQNAVLWARVGCAFLPFIAAAAYEFEKTLFETAAHRKIVAVIAWVVAVQFAVLALATNYLVAGVHQTSLGFAPTYTIAALIAYPLFFVLVFGAIVADTVREYANVRERERKRVRMFAIGLTVACFAVVNLFYPIGWLSVLASTTIIVSTIAKYGLPATTPALPATEIISTMRDLLLVSDRDGYIRFANNSACTFLGYTRDDIVGLKLEDLVAPTDRNAAAPLQGWVRDREYMFRTRMGQPIELTLSHSPITREDGEVTGAVIIGRDLRERKKYEWEARRAVSLLESTLESTADGILVISHDGRILTWNQRFVDIWGIAPDEMRDDEFDLIGHLVPKLVDPAAFIDTLASLQEHPEDESMQVLELKDGRRLEQYSLGRYIDDAPIRVWSFRDVTARLAAEQQIEFQAYHDALTQLPNRRLFLERLEMHLLAAKRARSNVAVLFIDLDRFKTINDTLGHDVADQLLIEIANRLRSCVRQTDTVARHGGDEFTIILPDLHQAEDAAQVAEKILERVVEPVIVGTTSIEISVSIGIAVHPHDGSDIDTLLRNADDAMYRAKQAGRNNYQLCTEEMKTRAIERSSMQSRLRKAMDDNELTLVYQPEVSLSSGQIVAAEAILRWHDPLYGIIEARDFIPVAEETRLIVPLGEWALFSACRQLRSWIDGGLPRLRMTVNISARQFQQRDLATVVKRAIDDARIDPSLLELEIHETTAMRDVNLTIELLNLLRDVGVSLAVDDFGSSYSSLGSLRTLPINALKLDRVLVSSVPQVEADATIASAVIGVSRQLGLRVAADGVESEAQFDFLKQHGCHEARGPYFSDAVDPEGFSALAASGITNTLRA